MMAGAHVASLPYKVRRRVKALKKLQPKMRFLFRGILFIGVVAYAYMTCTQYSLEPAPVISSRHLLQANTTDCLLEELNKYNRVPGFGFSADQVRSGGFVLYIIGVVYM